MKIVRSYKVKIKHYNQIFEQTIAIYRSALSMVIDIFNKEWEAIMEIESAGNKRKGFAEKLIHSTRNNQAKYPEFDQSFYKFPSYLRRGVIADALGIVSSYKSNQRNWEKNGRNGKEPTLNRNHFKFPTMYKDNMYVKEEKENYTAKIKIYHQKDWVWLKVAFRKSDIDYILRHKKESKGRNPILEKRGRNWYLRFSFETNKKLTDKKKIIIAVDLGVTTSATCCAMLADGTVIGRKFINHPIEKDQQKHMLNRIKKNQRRGNRRNPKLWTFANNKNQAISEKTSKEIMDFAIEQNADVIVFEHLNITGKTKGSKKQKLHLWRKREVQRIVTHKAHEMGMRVSTVNAWNTSRLAYDGSGKVQRGKEIDKPYSICRFSSGKEYHSDLNASYNIGARYHIREICKTLSVRRRLEAEAKVPPLSKRSTCTLSDLIKLNAVIGGNAA
jgi:IS605 OrfB family transposase